MMKLMDLLAIGMPGGGEILVILIITFGIILPIVAIIDIAGAQFEEGVTKVLWVAIVIFAPIIGSIIYFLIGYKQKLNKNN
ncbi:PLDc N-terminal domain-containing protein [Roseivirga spongicola]|uniref:PLDc N-terminal domain-containing protein n=1 Tax=Roseivirga spongicola TaxID=333140 RepID=UPI002AC9D8AD|nr:PLDc N-terminal domain-containing protein [Roseivirga spongicola]WPZ09666.1 PLDc N-terminal domain-containing protein [Roseivirga spongicola]